MSFAIPRIISTAIPRIMSALGQGYSISQIINHLIKTKNPLAKPIQEALKQGYTPDQIGEYLTKGRSKSYGEQQGMLAGMTEKEKGERIANYQPPMQRAAIQAIPKAAGALGTYALGRALPSVLQQLAPGLVNQPVGAPPTPPVPPGVPPIPVPVQSAPPIPPPAPAFAPIQPNVPASQILEQLGVKDRVDNMLKAGNTPEAVSATLTAQGKKGGVTDQELINTIDQYSKEKPIEPTKPIEKSISIQKIQSNIEQPKTEKKPFEIKEAKNKKLTSGEAKTLLDKIIKFDEPIYDKYFGKGFYKNTILNMSERERENFINENADKFNEEDLTKFYEFYKNWPREYTVEYLKNVSQEDNQKQPEQPESKKIVALPDGKIGEVESVKDGIAKINVDGQTRHRKEEDLIESPIPEKELADLYDDLIRGIEKKTGQDVSRNVYWAGYDPKTNELAYLPHDGGFFVYDDISEKDKKELTNILSTRKTTGENYIGAWEAESRSPIGAGMSKLIQRLQKERGGKGKEYSGKFEKVYDALEPAKKALKEKKKKEKQGEKPKKTKKPRSN